MVYIKREKSKSEDVFHRSSNCPMIAYDRHHNQNVYRQVSEVEAKSRGYRPCRRSGECRKACKPSEL